MVAITEEQRLAIREFKSRINSYNFVIDHEEPVLPIGSIESYTAQLHLADEYLTNHPSLNHDEFNTIGLPLYVKKVMTRKIELEQLLVEPQESALDGVIGLLNFKTAKEQLIKNAVGSNDYENITTWEELEEKAIFEQSQALFHADQLGEVVSAASEHSED